MLAWRIAKRRHGPFDGEGAGLHGGRWSSAGWALIYAADTYAGAILEVLAHALRPRTLPGPHHAVRIEIPDELIEKLEPEALPGWEAKESPEAREFGDQWLAEARSAVLVVPAVTSRPIGRNVLINPAHGEFGRIAVSDPFDVEWDEHVL